MQTQREVHSKEFQSQMFVNCFNECTNTSAAFTNTNLTASEGKCLKQCYIATAKRLQSAAVSFGFDAQLAHKFE
jgi:hypothetical protein